MALYNFTTHETVRRMPYDTRAMYGLLGDAVVSLHQQHEALHQEHLILSQATIRRTAELALERSSGSKPTRALLLGAGACFDIPLEFIAENFDRTMLVDVHTMPTALAVAQLPERLQAKIHLVEADVTGVAAEISEQATQLAIAMPSYEAFVGPAASMLSHITTEGAAPDLGTGYDLVTAHLFSSQLPVGLKALTEQRTRGAYNRTISQAPGGEDGLLVNAFEELGGRVQAANINYLARLVSERGCLHYADTYLRASTGETESLAFEPIAPEHFEPLAPMVQWEWTIEPARTFTVVAQALALHPHHAL